MSLFEFYQRANLAPLWPEGEADVVSVQAGSESAGEKMRLQCRWQDNQIVETRYKVQGCGHAIAACVWLSEQLLAGTWQAIDGQQVISVLSLPEEKYHTAWLIEDLVISLKKVKAS